MARREVRVVLCDLHDRDAPADETVRFSLDRREYEIDVCADHAEELRDDVEEFVGAGRAVVPRQRTRRR